MATVCHSERRDNKAPNKYKYQKHAYCSKYQINASEMCFNVWRQMREQWEAGSRWKSSPRPAWLELPVLYPTRQPPALPSTALSSTASYHPIFSADARRYEIILPNCIMLDALNISSSLKCCQQVNSCTCVSHRVKVKVKVKVCVLAFHYTLHWIDHSHF